MIAADLKCRAAVGGGVCFDHRDIAKIHRDPRACKFHQYPGGWRGTGLSERRSGAICRLGNLVGL